MYLETTILSIYNFLILYGCLFGVFFFFFFLYTPASTSLKSQVRPQNGLEAKDLGVATQFRFKNQIGLFRPLTYMHRFVYQIKGLEFGYGLGMYQTPKTAQLVGEPPLCVVNTYLIKEFIKRALIFNLNIHHALK